jgi:hypothetical protein
MCEREVPGGALNLNSTGYPDHGHYGDLSLQRTIPMEEPAIDPGTSWLVARSSDHQTMRLVKILGSFNNTKIDGTVIFNRFFTAPKSFHEVEFL